MLEVARKIRVILLPCLNGTAHLFDEFIAKCPSEFEPIPISFPTDQIHSYESLATEIYNQIEGDSPLVILGESFSGPLALRFAAMQPAGLIAVVLVASFVMPPVPG